MKAIPLSPLRAEHISGEKWRLLEPFEWMIFTDGEEPSILITIPAGFVSDGASVPRFPGMYLLFGGKARKAATLHDWLYREGQRSREWCDEVFKAAMMSEEKGWRRAIMWAGVRIGGWTSYKGPQDDLPTEPPNGP